jgi:hypothetical protein
MHISGRRRMGRFEVGGFWLELEVSGLKFEVSCSGPVRELIIFIIYLEFCVWRGARPPYVRSCGLSNLTMCRYVVFIGPRPGSWLLSLVSSLKFEV